MAILLGLTGSLGSGKSTVSRMLAEMGALVIDADRLAREAAEPGGEGYGEIVRAFGPAVVRSGGDLDREALARIVFADPARRRELEAILHPLVRRAMRERIQQAPPGRLVVLDVPLLFENGLDGECDATCAVVVDEAVRMAPRDIESRLRTQMPQEEKARRADYIIDNSGSREATRLQARRLVDTLTTLAKRGESFKE
ncbi:MAG: Dephospho-CoA kinase [candidate division BRC1 bacterium ADurb.BinA364]|nr:MAG: Dephospho-CoA kinase [candidate division BRC1 bacterium ADurb.BinA364]